MMKIAAVINNLRQYGNGYFLLLSTSPEHTAVTGIVNVLILRYIFHNLDNRR